MVLPKMFRGSGAAAETQAPATRERTLRRSTGLQEFAKYIHSAEALTVLDLGPTSASNIMQITSLGHKIYNEDLLSASTDSNFLRRGEDGSAMIDVERFFAENLIFRGAQFDAVMGWDIADYLPESLVKPIIDRIAAIMKPGGMLLGFFHTRDAGPDAPYCRYHIAGADALEMQPLSRFRLQRVFNNRNIENLFHDFRSLKFFLSRDYIREVLAIR